MKITIDVDTAEEAHEVAEMLRECAIDMRPIFPGTCNMLNNVASQIELQTLKITETA
jgi:hypothetical protein